MADREKVLNGLECCRVTKCEECPYRKTIGCITNGLVKSALELLKEQEAQIERLEHDLAVTQNNLNYYVNGND